MNIKMIKYVVTNNIYLKMFAKVAIMANQLLILEIKVALHDHILFKI